MNEICLKHQFAPFSILDLVDSSIDAWCTNHVCCDVEGDCEEPEPIGNGFILSRGPYFNGSFVIYTCQQGYSMTGAAQRECVSKVWSGDLPTCTIYTRNRTSCTY